MTNELITTCACRGTSGSDLIPLVVMVVLLVGMSSAMRWLKRKGIRPVKHMKQISAVVVLIAAVGVVFALKHKQAKPEAAAPIDAEAPATATVQKSPTLPRLVDLGADKCIPCKMMAPILEEVKKTYAGQLQVDFIDVWKNPGAGEEYGVRVIPTQIFFGPDGKELARHEGFMSREDILGQWAKLGITFEPGAETSNE